MQGWGHLHWGDAQWPNPSSSLGTSAGEGKLLLIPKGRFPKEINSKYVCNNRASDSMEQKQGLMEAEASRLQLELSALYQYSN